MTPSTAEHQQLHAHSAHLQSKSGHLQQEFAKQIYPNEALQASKDRYQTLVEAQPELLYCFTSMPDQIIAGA
jgi:hypothetical protein